MDVLTPEQRHRNMQAIKSNNTKMELLFSKTLWSLGYRYRKNDKRVKGKPDISFFKYRVAIFIDGEYFHGKDWEINKYKIKTNRDFWWKKIENNIDRDVKITLELEKQGWKVLRFWSKEVKKNLNKFINLVEIEIKQKRNAEKL